MTEETPARRYPTRGGRGRWRRSLETVESDRRCAELAAQGWTYDAIAAEVGYANRSVAYRAAQRCMYETAVEDGGTEELRRQQVEELRLVRQRMWEIGVSVRLLSSGTRDRREPRVRGGILQPLALAMILGCGTGRF